MILLQGQESNMDERQWETAAKVFCCTMGLAPDEVVQDLSYTGGGWRTRHRWQNAVDELKRHNAIQEAIEFGKSTQRPG